jgi:FkbM family methyltransferase
MIAQRRERLTPEVCTASSLPPADAVLTDVGELLMPSGDQVMRRLIAEAGDWELDEAMLFGAHLEEGMVVVDVGAHVGYYTLLAAQRVGPSGHVVSVEPDPTNFALLCANVERNGLGNVEALNAAAWDADTELDLVRNPENTGDHRIAGTQATGETAHVRAIRVDPIVERLGRVDVVKIDAQGTDRFAARGMETSLRRFKPVMFVELWPEGLRDRGQDPEAYVSYFRSLGDRMTMPGVQVDFAAWGPGDFVAMAERLPGGFGTLVLRPGRDVSGGPGS